MNFAKLILVIEYYSLIWWHLTERFHYAFIADKVVEVGKYPNGEEKVVSYKEFLRIKKGLPEEIECSVKSLTSSIEDYLNIIGYVL
jgi:hypothetical protein